MFFVTVFSDRSVVFPAGPLPLEESRFFGSFGPVTSVFDPVYTSFAELEGVRPRG
jgi:hypothetical protein